jgi:hypothetical protein
MTPRTDENGKLGFAQEPLLLRDSAYPPPWENISMIPKKSLE